jgi:hypothetical protein
MGRTTRRRTPSKVKDASETQQFRALVRLTLEVLRRSIGGVAAERKDNSYTNDLRVIAPVGLWVKPDPWNPIYWGNSDRLARIVALKT